MTNVTGHDNDGQEPARCSMCGVMRGVIPVGVWAIHLCYSCALGKQATEPEVFEAWERAEKVLLAATRIVMAEDARIEKK